MPTMNFTDGMSINTDGQYRMIRKSDGLYVVGNGLLCAVDTREEGLELLTELNSKQAKLSLAKLSLSKAKQSQAKQAQLSLAMLSETKQAELSIAKSSPV